MFETTYLRKQMMASGFFKTAPSRFPVKWVYPTLFTPVRRIIGFYHQCGGFSSWNLTGTHIPSQIWPKLSSKVTIVTFKSYYRWKSGRKAMWSHTPSFLRNPGEKFSSWYMDRRNLFILSMVPLDIKWHTATYCILLVQSCIFLKLP